MVVATGRAEDIAAAPRHGLGQRLVGGRVAGVERQHDVGRGRGLEVFDP